ncbi:MAG: 2-oxo acid dehydrogenase subunit E2, partial [Bacteroidota bacterium]
MAKVEIVIPRMGESIIEATITRWLKTEGDMINEDDAIAEIATDKVDSEITSPISGKFIKKFYNEGDTVAIGTVIALVANEESDSIIDTPKPVEVPVEAINISAMENSIKEENTIVEEASDKFYSPLVKSIAKAEGISLSELDTIKGSAKDGRLNKEDVLNYIKNKGVTPVVKATPKQIIPETPKVISSSGDQIVEMDRMRKLIADHMVMSKHTSPHVTSFIEVDMTNIVMWRNKTKDSFEKREGEKLTFTPIFIEAAAKALKEYPGVNASVDGTKIILRKNINIGMATALPNGNLIVPV